MFAIAALRQPSAARRPGFRLSHPPVRSGFPVTLMGYGLATALASPLAWGLFLLAGRSTPACAGVFLGLACLGVAGASLGLLVASLRELGRA